MEDDRTVRKELRTVFYVHQTGKGDSGLIAAKKKIKSDT